MEGSSSERGWGQGEEGEVRKGGKEAEGVVERT